MKMIHDQELMKYYLNSHQLLDIFPEAVIPHFSLCRFDPGELICSQGEAAQYLYVLVKGKVKIYTTSTEGKTLVLSFRTPLEVIGDIEYIRRINFLNTVEAVSSVDMIFVHHRWLDKYGTNHSPMLRFLLDIITKKFCMKSDYLTFNLLYPVEVRLASYLLSMCFDEANTLVNGQINAESLKDAANLLGISQRHLNRVIRQFCAQGLIERNKSGIMIKSREGIHALASQNIYE
ncbi:cyclic nucleotide-binding domain-containing protein [Paenibacillus alkalitolerans]|uniref:cyclic nucleotide-binding domain-containing protein n=1 Tax=Paenibacillus alkalitolerans TaxID=2799335 RepID=UPI0018F29AFB|nr:cyclic nucleotide-binding domain-containing protein [Paenibacillus alkalitolerans]